MSTEKQTTQDLDIDIDIDSDEDKDEDIEVIEIKKKKPNMSFSTEITPRSKLFGKTQSLLQQIEKSNQELKQKIDKMGTDSVSIENFDPLKNKSSYVDMDLFVGILEEKNDKIQQQKVQSRTDKLLGINQKLKKSVIIQESDSCDDEQDIDL
eukprot:UN00630